MMFSCLSAALVAAVAFSSPAAAAAASGAYSLSDSYTASNFADQFDWFNETDPTKGFVQYENKATALGSSQLAGKTASGAIYLGTDATSKVTSGRPSVRISSKKAYNYHLAVFDVAHMPYGLAVWGALWELGSGAQWPDAGEIDIVEGVNQQVGNLATLHSGDNCQVTNSPASMTGKMTTTDCYVNSGSQPGNAGCSVTDATPASWGSAFNAAGGGVYAMEYAADAISIWFFPRSQIPADISSNSESPSPDGWGTPVAKFAGSCQLASKFKNMQIIVNTAVCGSWAGTVWNTTDAATGKSPAAAAGVATCDDYAANNPTAFEQAYWEINSIRVYEQGNGASAGASATGAAAAAAGTATASAVAVPARKKRADGQASEASVGGNDGIFGSYNATSDEGYQQCEDLTPGFCKSKAEAPAQGAASVTGISGAMVVLAVAAGVPFVLGDVLWAVEGLVLQLVG